MNAKQIATVLACLVVFAPRLALADDVGPSADVRALRYAAPILAEADARWETLAGQIVVDDVVVEGDDALLQWHVGINQRIDRYQRQAGVWWRKDEVWLDPKSGAAFCCGGIESPGDTDGPMPSFLIDRLRFPAPVVTLAAAHLPAIESAVARFTPPPPGAPVRCCTHGDGWFSDSMSFATQAQAPNSMGNNVLTIAMAPNDASVDARLTGLGGGTPASSDLRATVPGTTYFSFSARVSSKNPVHVSEGTTLEIYRPFVLDPSLHYVLTVTGSDSLLSAAGVLDRATNTLYFVLPAFVVSPGANVVGTVTAR